jgi:hypothetical protein
MLTTVHTYQFILYSLCHEITVYFHAGAHKIESHLYKLSLTLVAVAFM